MGALRAPYTPLLLHWARRIGLQEQDAEDLVQDVLVVLVRKMPEFQYQPGRTFRGWMRTVLMNRWRDRPHRGAPAALDSVIEPVAQPADDDLEAREYRLYIMGRALQLMVADFEQVTWQACWDTVVLGRPAAEVAAALNISVNAVYLARSRVLGRSAPGPRRVARLNLSSSTVPQSAHRFPRWPR